MRLTEFHIPNAYDNPLTESGRGRTIAAFRLAQGDVETLTTLAEMRRDVLTALTSTSAINHWLNSQGWLERSRKAGKVQLLRLTDAGFKICAGSLARGGTVPTTPELVSMWTNRMKNGAPGYEKKTFPPLPEI